MMYIELLERLWCTAVLSGADPLGFGSRLTPALSRALRLHLSGTEVLASVS
jgi:hypothetical protein